MVQRFRIPATYLLICGLLVAISLLWVGVPDVQAQASNSCPEGQIWSLNRCTDEEETTCQSGYTYVADNGCVLIEEDSSACPRGYEMSGGRCQAIGQSCPAGEVWRDGSCQVRDEQSCPAGQERVNGSCFQITDTVCPVGYSWSDSKDRCDENDDDDDSRSGAGAGTGTGTVVTVVSPGLTFSDDTLTVTEGGDGTYTVVLNTKPTADVTVTIDDPSNPDVTIDPPTLTFTPENWNVPQTVTVTAKEDTDQLHETATVTHTVSGAADYNSVTAPDATVTVTDNDVPTLNAVVQERGGLAESESTTSTNVVLDVTFTLPYTIYRYGESTWHSLQGATSIKVEAFWQEESGNPSTISQNLWTDPRNAEDSVCLDIAPDAATQVYEIDQTLVLPTEPENAEPGNWELRLRVEFDGVEAGECNASDPTVPLTSVDASTWVENLEEEEDE